MRLLRIICILTCLYAFNGIAQETSQNVVEIPNVFTPNGDGANDVFRIDATGFEDVTVSIFNRYGELVYRYYGVNGSWDGFTHAGVKVSPGVYYVYAEVSNSDGESYTDQETLTVTY